MDSPQAIAALIAGILSLLLGLYNAVENRELKRLTAYVNTVTSERVRWIGRMKENLADLCGTAHYWRFSTARGSVERQLAVQKIDRLRHLIVLELSSDDSDTEIRRLVGNVVTAAATEPHDMPPETFRVLLDSLTDAGRRRIRREQETVEQECRRYKIPVPATDARATVIAVGALILFSCGVGR